MVACNCTGPGGNCPCKDRGGYYYATKVIRPEAPATRSPMDLLHRFSVPELREIMAEQGITGRGRNTKERMVELLYDHLASTDSVGLISEYADRYGRSDVRCPCR